MYALINVNLEEFGGVVGYPLRYTQRMAHGV